MRLRLKLRAARSVRGAHASRVLAKPSRVRELLFELDPAPIANSSTNRSRRSPLIRAMAALRIRNTQIRSLRTIGRLPESVTRCPVLSMQNHPRMTGLAEQLTPQTFD